MNIINLCPTVIDIYIAQNDIQPWTFTIRNSSWQVVDITGLNFELYIYAYPHSASGHTHDEEVTPAEPQIVVGTVTDAANGVVEFALSGLQAATDHGTYYYELHEIDGLDTIVLVNGNFTFLEDMCGCMPQTDVDICNMALSFIGESADVLSVDPPDPSPQARLCNMFYPIALQATLDLQHWSFATNTEVLTVHECDRDAWDYCYMLPHDFQRPIAVLPTGSTDDSKDAQDFVIEQDTDGVLRLFTDQEDAVLRYCTKILYARDFTPLFSLVLSWHLASMLAGATMKGKEGAEESKRCLQMMGMYLGQAGQSDAIKRNTHPVHTPEWMAKR